MRKSTLCYLLTVFAVVIFTSGCETMEGEKADVKPSTKGMVSDVAPPVTGPERMAQGAQQDSLQACLNRIPEDATASQRMLAESTCNKNAEKREDFDKIPAHKRDPY